MQLRTVKDFLNELQDEGRTLADWARDKGMDQQVAYMIARGRCTGRRGKSRAVMKAMGVAVPPMFPALGRAMDAKSTIKPRYVWTPSGPVLKQSLVTVAPDIAAAVTTRRPLQASPAGLRFGTELKRQRELLGLTQQQAADKVGVTREGYGRYERGMSLPNSRVLASMGEHGFSTQPLIDLIHERATA